MSKLLLLYQMIYLPGDTCIPSGNCVVFPNRHNSVSAGRYMHMQKLIALIYLLTYIALIAAAKPLCCD